MDSSKSNDFQQKKSKERKGDKSRTRANWEKEWKLSDPLDYYDAFNC